MICKKALEKREAVIEAELERHETYKLVFEYDICPECGGDITKECNVVPLPANANILHKIFNYFHKEKSTTYICSGCGEIDIFKYFIQ